MWDLIVSAPDHWLSFYFSQVSKWPFSTFYSLWETLLQSGPWYSMRGLNHKKVTNLIFNLPGTGGGIPEGGTGGGIIGGGPETGGGTGAPMGGGIGGGKAPCAAVVDGTPARLKECSGYQFMLYTLFKHINRITAKPTKWLCTQRRLRSAWALAQSDQCLRSVLNG